MTKIKTKNAQDVKLEQLGYIRVSEAARKIGRDVGYVHRHLAKGFFDEASGTAMRIGALWYVYEPQLAMLIGPRVAQIMDVRMTGFPPPIRAAKKKEV